MSVWTLTLVLAALRAGFEMHTLPLVGGLEDWVMMASMAPGAAASLLVQQGNTLTPYSGSAVQPGSPIVLEEGVSCFDVADLDADGVSEVVAIRGEQIQRYPFPAQGAPAAPPTTLFTLRTVLASLGKRPLPFVMAHSREGRMLLALPVDSGIELRALDGTLVGTIPLKIATGEDKENNSRFAVYSIAPSVLAAPDALENEVWQHLAPALDLPDAPAAGAVAAWSSYMGWGDQAQPEKWSWFPLRTNRSPALRVLCARTSAEESCLRISSALPKQPLTLEGPEANTGPRLRYPGALLFPTHARVELPDFNGDGFTDIAQWRAADLGVSTDAITRAIAGGAWKVDVTVHFFAPEKNRHNPAPAARLGCLVPISRFVSLGGERDLVSEQGRALGGGSPLWNYAFGDCDGDGHSDFACSTANNTYSVWLWKDKGFSERADTVQTLPGPAALEFCASLDGAGRTAIALRTEHALHVLRMPE